MSSTAEDTSLQNEAASATTSSFIAALIFNAALFGIQAVLFTFLRPHFKAIYEPRTYVPPKPKRAAPIGPSLLAWIPAVFKSDIEDIINANGLDAYFFLRFIRMCIKILFPIWIVSWAVLLPVTSVNSRKGDNEKLELFVFGNVRNDQPERYAAHIILAWFFTFYILYVLRAELSHFVYKRQLFLISPEHARSVMANTVLITGIPGPYQSTERLTRIFKDVPGGVKTVWLNRNLKDLPELYERQVAACDQLEKAETNILKAAAQAKLKADKQKAKIQGDPEKDASKSSDIYLPEGDQRPHHKLGFLGLFGEKVDTIEWARKEIVETGEAMAKARGAIWGGNAPWEEQQHVQEEEEKARAEDRRQSTDHERGTSDADLDHTDLEDRQGASTSTKKKTLPIPSIPIPGANVVGGAVENLGDQMKKRLDLDKQDEVKLLEGENAEKGRSVRSQLKLAAAIVPGVEGIVSKDKSGADEYPLLNSAFVTFKRQIGAHMAAQVLLHSGPYRMTGKYLETSPEDVIWTNLGMDPYAMKVRSAISWALTIGLIVTWGVPVFFIGILSNVEKICTTVSWLNWICDLPDTVLSIIQGILPPVLLAVLFMLLPIILRLFAVFEGIPKRTLVELSLMTRYFLFQVIHGFLIVTLASGITASLDDLINDPTQIPNLLASELPKASTFFLTYIILQGLSGAAGGFLQIVPLVVYYVKLILLGSTPRSVYNIKFRPKMMAWGTVFPATTLLMVITVGYMIISPVINGLAFGTFVLFYVLYKYIFLWVFQQRHSRETGGLFFPKAIQHVFVGLYVQHVCLAALFFLARDENNEPSAVPEGALMIVLIVITAGVHLIYNHSYAPLYYSLPLSLADKSYSPPEDKEDVVPVQVEGASTEGDEDMLRAQAGDLFHEDKLEKYGYAHPAISRPQRIIWIPEDTLGLWKGEVEACRNEGVEADLGGDAKMGEKGKVDVFGPGPGEDFEEIEREEVE